MISPPRRLIWLFPSFLARLYATGAEQGTHYYAMEVIDGPSLDQVIRQMRAEKAPADATNPQVDSSGDSPALGPLPEWVGETIVFEGSPRPIAASRHNASQSGAKSNPNLSSSGSTKYFDNIARMIADVADALHHAHEEGVIHRDIKPSNLLLSADGRLSLNDFGLARVLEQPGMTMSGEFVGSPLYMSPEQITAGRAPLDHRTDIYSLGATLYELLTLEPPFPGQQRDQVIAQILHKEPVPARRKNRKVPVDLETICMKALEKDPDRRYQTAGQMAEDLRHFVNRFAISARRVGPVGRMIKWARRSPALASLIGVAAVAVLAFLFVAQQLRASKLEQAMELTRAHLLSGAFDNAEQELVNAEALHAEPGRIELLRGELEIYRGNYSKAQSHLDKAMNLLGDNISTKALRTIAKFQLGEEATYLYMLEELREARPISTEECLHVGLAQTWGDPFLAEDQLNKVFEQRGESPIVRLFRSVALETCAAASAAPQQKRMYAQKAIVDAQIAQEVLKNNWEAASTLAYAHIQAATASHMSRDDRAANDHLAIASLMLPRIPTVKVDRFFLMQVIGQEKTALQNLVSQELTSAAEFNYLAAFQVIAAFRLGKYDKALTVANSIVEVHGRHKEGFGYLAQLGSAEMESEQAREELLAKVRATVAYRYQNPERFWNIFFDWAVLRLLSQDGEARELGRFTFNGLSRFECELLKAGRPAAKFMTQPGDADALIAMCGDSSRALAEGCFVAGIDALAQGKRSQARKYFALGKEKGFPSFYTRQWCIALLERLEREPNWPSWINDDLSDD